MSNPCISSSKVKGTAVYNANGDKLGSDITRRERLRRRILCSVSG
jgi:hypothetical protein